MVGRSSKCRSSNVADCQKWPIVRSRGAVHFQNLSSSSRVQVSFFEIDSLLICRGVSQVLTPTSIKFNRFLKSILLEHKPLLACFGCVTSPEWLVSGKINLRKRLSLIDVGADVRPDHAKVLQGTSRIRNTPLVGRYRSPMPWVLWWSNGGLAVSYERGTPVAL